MNICQKARVSLVEARSVTCEAALSSPDYAGESSPEGLAMGKCRQSMLCAW